MKKITVFIENNKKDLYLDVSVNKLGKSIMTLNNAAIYWKYKNVIAGDNDYVMYGAKKITFEEGYWTFNMMKEKLENENVKLEANKHNDTCKIRSNGENLNLKKFAPLLGFPENKILSDGSWETSPKVVDVNRGLRYININCSIVDTSENFNTDGKRSQTMASIPIPTEQSLNSTVTFLKNINGKVKINNGCFNRLIFDVDTNIENKVDMDLLLEICII